MKKLVLKKEYSNFVLEEIKKSDEINSEIFVFEHKILGTKLFFIKNEDKEKAFTVSFKTPSPDSKGYQHILEHSVLRSSEKYDFGNKEVFSEILRKSSVTFLNAATYDDKTIYPFSTMLESEFFKIMDIYTDAVLNPLVLKNENYFRQEGWRWEKNSDGKYFINGVVFNEMKGRLSSNEVFAWGKMMEKMFPNTEYKFNAGGEPDKILNLNYQDFKKYHKKYYHPSNATFFVYGNLDILKVMEKLEEDFLVNFRKEKKAEKSRRQVKNKKEVRAKYFFPSHCLEKNSILNIAFLANDNKEIKESFVNYFLTSILFDKNSVLYKNIMDSKMVSNLEGYYGDDILQGLFNVNFNGLDIKNFKKVEKIFFDSLVEISKNGFNKNIIESKLNKFEYGIFAKNFSNGKGLKIMEEIMKTQLHKNNFEDFFKYKENITFLKNEIKNGGLEKRLKKYFLKNSHKVILRFEPKRNFDVYPKLTEKIKEVNEKKNKKVLEKIDEKIVEFKKYQKELPPKDFEKLIKVVDKKSFPQKIKKSKVVVSEINGVKNYFQKIISKEISSYQFVFDGNFLKESEIKYAKFLTKIITELAPVDRNKDEFLESMSKNTAHFSMNFDNLITNNKDLNLKFLINLKFLTKKENMVFSEVSELLSGVNFDKKIIEQKIEKEIDDFKNSLAFSGNFLSEQRANSKISQNHLFDEKIGGIDYYFFLKELKKEVAENFEKVKNKFENIYENIFTKKNLVVLTTSFKKNDKIFEKLKLTNKSTKKNKIIFKLEKKNEGIIFENLDNSFNAIASKIEKPKKSIHKISTMANFLSYGFLWEKVREEGGAYGCRCSVLENYNILNITSYMDSRISGTFDDYKKVGNFLKEKDFSNDEISGVVATILSGIIAPKNIFSETVIQFQKDFLKIDLEKENKILNEKKSLTEKDIKKMSTDIEKAIKNSVKVSIGPKNKIMEDKRLFDKIIIID